MKKKFCIKLLLLLSMTLAMTMSSVITSSAFTTEVNGVTYVYVFNDTGITLTEIRSSNDPVNLNIPSKIYDYTINEIGNGKEMPIGDSCLDIENVTISNCVERINANAFHNFRKLKKVEIGDSVEYIGKKAFPTVNTIILHTKTPPQIDGCICEDEPNVYVEDDVYFDYLHSIWSEEHSIKKASNYTGTILSKGDIALVATISIIVIAAVVLLVVRRRKHRSAKC